MAADEPEASSQWPAFMSCGGCCRTARDDKMLGMESDIPYRQDDKLNLGSSPLQTEGEHDIKGLQATGTASEGSTSMELIERPATEIPPGGATYTGQWKGKEFHGKGQLVREDGSFYDGFFDKGKAHGHGKFRAANGNVYEGEWLWDRAHGHGTYSHEDGSTYAGEWLNDEKCGTGTESYADGSRYEGEFRHSAKNGNGKYVSPTGKMVFQGQMRQDRMHGEGTYFFTDGRVFTGQWKYGLRQGEGFLRWPDGRSYRGQWREGKQDGNGVMVSVDGSETKGSWYQGQLTVNPSIADGTDASQPPASQ